MLNSKTPLVYFRTRLRKRCIVIKTNVNIRTEKVLNYFFISPKKENFFEVYSRDCFKITMLTIFFHIEF